MISTTTFSQSLTNSINNDSTHLVKKCFDTVQIDSLYSKLYDGNTCKKELKIVYELVYDIKNQLKVEQDKNSNLSLQISNLEKDISLEQDANSSLIDENEILNEMYDRQKRKTTKAYFIGGGVGVVGTLTYLVIKSISN